MSSYHHSFHFDGSCLALGLFYSGGSKYGEVPCSRGVWVGQSPEDFDLASLGEEQGLAGSGQAGTG